MALPEQVAEFVLRTIFDLTAKSVSKLYNKFYIRCYPRDVGNFTRWGAALLGLSVFADEPMQYELLGGAINRFLDARAPEYCQAATYLFSSLAHTFLSCGSCESEEIVNPVSYLIIRRCLIENAFRKGGIDDLCSLCFPVILKAQKAFLEAHKDKDVIKRFLREVSKGEDLEHLFKFLREEALNEKDDYLWSLKSSLNISGETYDEEFDRADSEEAETYSRDGSNEAETCKKDGFEEAETHNRDGSEEAETLNGSDSDGTKSLMEVDKASSDEKKAFQVSSDEETLGNVKIDERKLMSRLRATAMMFAIELHCFSQGCDVESRMEKLYQEVIKVEEYSLEQAMMELKDIILSVILEQFRRSADEAHKAGSESADNWTSWGSALLGISIQNGGEGLQAAVEKLDRALSLDGGSGRTDTLCYASCAYGSLYCLTFGSPESQGFLNTAKTYIEKAVCMDPDEDLFTRCQAFIDSLEERMLSSNKELRKEKRKYGDAFV